MFAPVPPRRLPAASWMLSSSARFRPRVPLPVPVLAVTVQVVPLPLTLVMAAPLTPPPCTRAKSAALTPVTASLKVTVQSTLPAPAVGFGLATAIALTAGVVRSKVYAAPGRLPLSVPLPPRGTLLLTMLSSSTRFRPRVPLPVPVLAVTVRVVPVPVTLVMAAPVTPVCASVKSLASTFVTLALKVTVQDTLAALVGLAPASAMLLTVG